MAPTDPDAPPPDAPNRPSRLAMGFVLLTLALDAAGMGLIMPVMPSLLQEFSLGGSLAGAAEIGGWMAFSYAAAQFLCAPAVGAASDAFGRRPVLLAAMGTMALEYALMASTTSIWVLFAARIGSGMAGATVSAARAWLADVSTPEERGKVFGRIGAAFGAGFVLGPAIGGLLGELGPRAPFWAAAGLAALNFAIGWAALTESLPPERRRPFSLRGADPLRALRRATRLPGVGPLLLAMLLYDIGVHVYPAAWSFISAAAWGWSPAGIGASLALYGVSAGLAQAFLVGPAQARFGAAGTVRLGMALEVAATLLLMALTAGWAVYALIPLIGVTAITGPSLQGMISTRAPTDRQGEISGVLAALMGVAAILSPPVMTGIFAAATSGPPPHLPTAPFALSAAIVLGGLGVFALAMRREAAAVRTPRTKTAAE